MNGSEAKHQLMELQAKLCAYRHASGLLYYDGVTVAPKGAADSRGQTLSVLSEASYRLITDQSTGELLDFLEEHQEELDEKSRRMVFLLRKQLRQMRAIPMEEYIADQQLVNQAQDVWHTAKEQDNFSMFAPYLERIVENRIRFAGYMEPNQDPYDVWLNEYEGGLTRASCDAFFSALRERIIPLLQRVCAAPQPDDSFLHGHFPREKQLALSEYLMHCMGLNREHCGLGETEHPFTINFSRYDVRITTHFYEDHLAYAMYSTIHEGGHALYELHTAKEDQYTELAGGVSMGVHESQSRFYENLLGRSKPFLSLIQPKLIQLFPSLARVSLEELYRAVNKSQPSLIRTEADELTHCLHIMVRYEIEKMLFDRTIRVNDLPAAWNRLYEEYLGIRPSCDREGVLQDSHWSGGDLGYFPSYALGSAYGAQLMERMRESVDVDGCLAAGNFAPINQWLENRIWRFGSLYEPSQLLEKALGGPFDPSCFVRYLEQKFGEIYRLD